MTAVRKLNLVSVEDYLAGELDSEVKHEYLAGAVYAMAGGRNVHNLTASNLLISLGIRLRGGPCRPYNSDTKVRIRRPDHTRFYYPDAMVVCDANPPQDTFHDRPVILAEVVSARTRRIDEGEKMEAYLTIPTLSVYMLVEQNEPAVVVHRRSEQGFVREVYAGLEAVIPLPELDTELPLAEIYDGVQFLPEAEDAAD